MSIAFSIVMKNVPFFKKPCFGKFCVSQNCDNFWIQVGGTTCSVGAFMITGRELHLCYKDFNECKYQRVSLQFQGKLGIQMEGCESYNLYKYAGYLREVLKIDRWTWSLQHPSNCGSEFHISIPRTPWIPWDTRSSPREEILKFMNPKIFVIKVVRYDELIMMY